MEISLTLMPTNRNYDYETFLYERDNPLYDTLISIPKKITFKGKEYKFHSNNLSLDSKIFDLYYWEI